MKKILGMFCVLFIALLVGCYKPSPLYGNWSDNLGNKISFSADGTFSAMIVVNNTPVSYSGSYTVMDNVMSFSSGESTVVTEWDLRGSILYLQWTAAVSGSDAQILNLSLYHTS